MLKFPKIEGEVARKIRQEVLSQVPPDLHSRVDLNMAFDLALHASNSALETAGRVLDGLQADGPTRVVALTMFNQITACQIDTCRAMLMMYLTRAESRARGEAPEHG